jgi:hypothetical protein
MRGVTSRPSAVDRAGLLGEHRHRRRGACSDDDGHDEPDHNAAAGSIITPVALGIATRLGLNPVTLLALVATCISFTFINPFSHQSNLMMMGPGAYSTRTFAKFGAPSWSCRWRR